MKFKKIIAAFCSLALALTIMPTTFAATNWPATIDFEDGTIGFGAIANKSAGDTNWAVEDDPTGGETKVLRLSRKDGAMADLRMYMNRTGKPISFEFDTYRDSISNVSYIRLFEGSNGGCNGDGTPFLVKLQNGQVRNNNDVVLAIFEEAMWYSFKIELSADLTQERIYMKNRDYGGYEYIGSCVLPAVDLSKTADLFYYKYESDPHSYVDNFKFNVLDNDVVAGFTAGKDGENFDKYYDSDVTDGNFGGGTSAIRAMQASYNGATTPALFGKKFDDSALTSGPTGTYLQNRYAYLGLKEGDKMHIGVSVAFDEAATTSNDYYDFQFLRTIKDTYAVAGTPDANVRIAGADVLFLRATGDAQVTGGYATGLQNSKFALKPNHWYRVDFVFTVGKTGTATTGVKNHVDIYLDGDKINGYDFNGWDVNQVSMPGTKKTTDDIYALEGFASSDLRFRTNANNIYMDDFVFDKTPYSGPTFKTSLSNVEFSASSMAVTGAMPSVEELVASISGTSDVAVLAADFEEKESGAIALGDIVRVGADGTTYFYTVEKAATEILNVPFDALTGNATVDGKLQFAKAGKNYGPRDVVMATNYADASTADIKTVIKNYMFNDAVIANNIGNREDNVLAFHMQRPGAQYTSIKEGTKDASGNYTSITSIDSDPMYDPFTNVQNAGNAAYSTTKPVTFEGMFYESSNVVDMYLSPNNAWTSYGIGLYKNDDMIRVLGDRALPYRANAWYKWVLTYSPKGNDVYEVKAYVNGELIKTKDFTIKGGLFRLKAGFSAPNVAYDIVGAMDNQRIYFGEYDPTDDLIDIEADPDYISFVESKVKALEPLTAEEVIDTITTNASSVKIYTDATCSQEVDPGELVEVGNVLALVSASGESYKYYDFADAKEEIIVDDFESMDEDVHSSGKIGAWSIANNTGSFKAQAVYDEQKDGKVLKISSFGVNNDFVYASGKFNSGIVVFAGEAKVLNPSNKVTATIRYTKEDGSGDFAEAFTIDNHKASNSFPGEYAISLEEGTKDYVIDSENWVNFKTIFNLDSKTATFIVNGQNVGTAVRFKDEFSATDMFRLQIQNWNFGTSDEPLYYPAEAYFDNISIIHYPTLDLANVDGVVATVTSEDTAISVYSNIPTPMINAPADYLVANLQKGISANGEIEILNQDGSAADSGAKLGYDKMVKVTNEYGVSSVYYVNCSPIYTSYYGGTDRIAMVGVTDPTATIYFASYDEDGRLTGVELGAVSGVQAKAVMPNEGTLKAFVIDANMKPLK